MEQVILTIMYKFKVMVLYKTGTIEGTACCKLTTSFSYVFFCICAGLLRCKIFVANKQPGIMTPLELPIIPL